MIVDDWTGAPWPTGEDDDDVWDIPEEKLDELEEQQPDEDTVLDPSLDPIDLEPILGGDHKQPMPDMLFRADGRSLLYPGAVNGIHGGSGDGKGWVVCFAIRENLRRARRTMLLDFEDTPHSITSRLVELGLTADEILRWLIYIRPQVALGPKAVEHIGEIAVENLVTLVTIDSIGEAFALEGIDENKDVEVGPWYRRVPRPLADMGPAVLLIDHSTKAGDNPLHPSGSKRKRAAITGASYLAEAVEPFVKGRGGRLRMTCAKDRHGNYRRGEVAGDLVMYSNESVITSLDLYAPTAALSETTVPILLAARAAITAAKDEGKPLSRRALEGLMKIKCRAEIKRGGIDLAVTRGALLEKEGPRRAKLYEYLGDLEDRDSEPAEEADSAADKDAPPDTQPELEPF